MGLCQDWHIPLFFPMVAAALGLAYTLGGRVADASAAAEAGAGASRSPWTDRRHSGALVTCLGEAQLLAGRLEEAQPRAEQALDSPASTRNAATRPMPCASSATSRRARRSPEASTRPSHYQQALALAEELGMRPLQAHCHRGLGMLYATTGQREQARTELSTAIEMYRAMEMTFWLPETEAALAQVEGR